MTLIHESYPHYLKIAIVDIFILHILLKILEDLINELILFLLFLYYDNQSYLNLLLQ